MRLVLSGMLALALFAASFAPLSASAEGTVLSDQVIQAPCKNSDFDWASNDNIALAKQIIPDQCVDIPDKIWSRQHSINPSDGNSLSYYVKNRGSGTLTVTIRKNGVPQGRFTLSAGSMMNPIYTRPGGATWGISVEGTNDGIKMDIAARQY
jgi:hypothetical protein